MTAEPSPQTTPTKPRRGRAARLLRLAWRLVVVAVVLGVALYLLRNRLLAPLVIDLARGIAAEDLHGELEIDSLSGGWIGDLTIHGLGFRRDGDVGPIERIESAEVEVEYSILGYLRGEEGWLERVRLDARDLRLDLGGSDEAEASAEPGALERTLLLRPPELDVTADHVSVSLDDRRVEIEELAVETRSPGARPRYGIAARSFSVDGEAPTISPCTLAVTLGWNAGDVAIEELGLGDSLAIRGGRVDLRRRDEGRIAWELPLDVGGSVGELRGLLGAERIEASLELTEVRLADLEPFLASTSDPPPSGRLTLVARADLPRDGRGDGVVLLETEVVDLMVGDRVFDRVTARGSLVDSSARFEELVVIAGVNTITAREVSAPVGLDDPVAFVQRCTGRLELELRDVPALASPERRAELTETLPAHLVALTARMDEGTFEIETGRVVTSGGDFEVRRGRIELGTDPERLLEDGVLDVDFRVAFDDLGTVGELLGYDDWAGSLRGDLVLRGPLDAPTGEVVGTAREVAALGFAVDEAVATIHAEEGRIRADRLLVRSEAWEATATGAWATDTGELSEVRIEALVPELAAITKGAVRGRTTIEVRAAGPLERPEGELDVQISGLKASGMHADGIVLVGRFAGPSLDVEELVVASTEGHIQARGSVQRDPETGDVDVVVRSLSAQRDDSRLDLEEPVHVAWKEGILEVHPFVLAGELGRARGMLRHGEGRTVGSLELEDFDGMPLLEPFLPPGVRSSPIDADVQVDIGPEASLVAVSAAADALELGLEELPWTVWVEAHLADSLLTIQCLDAEQEELGGIRVAGTLPLDPFGEDPFPEGEVLLEIVADATELQRWPEALWKDLFRLEGSAQLEASLHGSWRELRGTLHARGDALRILEAGESPTEIASGTFEVEMDSEDGRHELRGEVRSPEHGSVTLSGGAELMLDVPALVESGFDPLLDVPLDLRAEIDVPDLAWIARRVPQVRRVAGSVGGTIELRGTAREPRLGGDVGLTAGELRLTTAFPAMRALEGRLLLEGDTVRVERFTGEFGASPFELTGELALEDEEPRLSLTIAGEDLLLYRSVDARVRADARLAVSGPISALRAEGELVLTDGRFGRDVDLFAALQGEAAPPSAARGLDLGLWSDPPLSALSFDVTVSASEPFVLKNNLIRGALRPDLRLTGTGEVPVLKGRVYVDETSLSLPSGRLLVESGLVLFGEENPFVPTLELNGRTRIKGYDIRARVTGDYDDPEIELSSTPPLPNEDLAILFLTGQLPEGTVGERGAGAAQTVAVYVAQDIVKRWFSDGGLDDEESILERLEIEIGTDVTRSGGSTARIVYLLTDRERRGKRERYLIGERDVYDKINFGYGFRFRFR